MAWIPWSCYGQAIVSQSRQSEFVFALTSDAEVWFRSPSLSRCPGLFKSNSDHFALPTLLCDHNVQELVFLFFVGIGQIPVKIQKVCRLASSASPVLCRLTESSPLGLYRALSSPNDNAGQVAKALVFSFKSKFGVWKFQTHSQEIFESLFTFSSASKKAEKKLVKWRNLEKWPPFSSKIQSIFAN